jgi:hypothetical protein
MSNSATGGTATVGVASEGTAGIINGPSVRALVPGGAIASITTGVINSPDATVVTTTNAGVVSDTFSTGIRGRHQVSTTGVNPNGSYRPTYRLEVSDWGTYRYADMQIQCSNDAAIVGATIGALCFVNAAGFAFSGNSGSSVHGSCSNTGAWTFPVSIATQKILARTNGTTPSTGEIGEVIEAINAATVTCNTTAGTWTTVTNLSISLSAGVWDLDSFVSVYADGSNGTGGNGRGLQAELFDSTNNVVLRRITAGFINAAKGVEITPFQNKHPITVSSPITVTVRVSSVENSSATTITTMRTNQFTTTEYLRAIRRA